MSDYFDKIEDSIYELERTVEGIVQWLDAKNHKNSCILSREKGAIAVLKNISKVGDLVSGYSLRDLETLRDMETLNKNRKKIIDRLNSLIEEKNKRGIGRQYHTFECCCGLDKILEPTNE